MLRLSSFIIALAFVFVGAAESVNGQLFRGLRRHHCCHQNYCQPVHHCHDNCYSHGHSGCYSNCYGSNHVGHNYGCNNCGSGCYGYQVQPSCGCNGGAYQGGIIYGQNQNYNNGQYYNYNGNIVNNGLNNEWSGPKQDCDDTYNACAATCNACEGDAKVACLAYCACQRSVCNGTGTGPCNLPACGGVIGVNNGPIGGGGSN